MCVCSREEVGWEGRVGSSGMGPGRASYLKMGQRGEAGGGGGC